jgi:penicillin-binding protein 2
VTERNELFGKISQIARMALLAILMLSLAFVCVVRLLQIQIADTYGFSAEHEQEFRHANQPIQAVRGQIADRSGRLLNTNETVHKVILQRAFLPFGRENEIIASVLDVLRRNDGQWLDSVPITLEQPFEFTNVPQSDMDKFLTNIGVNFDATVENCLRALAENYKIDTQRYCEQMIRSIGGVRYEMEARDFSFRNRFVLAEDVSLNVIIELMERALLLPGVALIQEPMRVYRDGTLLPHIRGRITAISPEQHAVLRDSGYSLNDTIGLFGLEESLESTLRGENGILEITRDTLWEVISAETTREARAGNSVKLTIDTEFQRMTEAILLNHIEHNNRNPGTINRTPPPGGTSGGSIAVIDVHTGGILALATYPNYDLNDYVELLLAENSGEPLLPNHPLRCRATAWGFRPGSSYKVATSVIGLIHGAITRESRISCGGRYHLFNRPNCWSSGCGSSNIVRALAQSCNVFYYEVGRRLGMDVFGQESIDIFGVGTDLNIDIRSDSGRMTTPANFQALHGSQMGYAELIQAAIGQSETLLTPVHLATIAATVANGGVRLRPHLVHSVWNYDFSELIYETQPDIVADSREFTEAFEATQAGMFAQSQVDGHRHQFLHLPSFPGYKTGTPELIPGELYNSTVIGYYPHDNPQIAFAVVIEGGDRASRAIRNIINAYFYGEFEPLPDDSRGRDFHVPWSGAREPIPGRYERVNPWRIVPGEILDENY